VVDLNVKQKEGGRLRGEEPGLQNRKSEGFPGGQSKEIAKRRGAGRVTQLSGKGESRIVLVEKRIASHGRKDKEGTKRKTEKLPASRPGARKPYTAA